MKKLTILAISALALLCSCSGGGLRIGGTVSGAGDSTTLALEYASNGMWLPADSARTSGNGEFSISTEAPEHPNIYRLRLGDNAIYFPVDSADNITINTSIKGFGSDYTLAGTPHAKQVMEIDKQAMKFASAAQPDSAKLAQWKRELAEQLIKEPQSIVAFYIINKSVNGAPLFDPADFDDLKIIGAVANAYKTYKPNDPRTDFLVNIFLDGQKRKRAAKGTATSKTIQATEAKLLDISLQDYNGKQQSLEQVAAQHPTVVLVFSVLHDSYSPALNKALKALEASGKHVFQVGLDDNEAVWRQSARDLTWTVVRDPMALESKLIATYNLAALPAAFIIHNGEIVERVDDVTTLQAAAAKY